MKATCACGQATITVNAAPRRNLICHCNNCKRRTGSAFGMSAYFDQSAVMAKEGKTQVYALRNEAQGHDQQRHFCTDCGTTLFWYVSSLPDLIGIAGGCFAGEGLGDPTASHSDENSEGWLTLPEHWQTHSA